jgi:hypothetical protein
MRRQTWQDAYDAQMGLWRWYRTEDGRDHLQAGYRMQIEPFTAARGHPAPEAMQEMIAGLYGAEERKVLLADPFFVSAEMVDVIEAAAEQFTPEALLATDVMTHTGFCWFERPFGIHDRFDEPMFLRGWSWCRIEQGIAGVGMPSMTEDGVILTMLRDAVDPEAAYPEGLAVTLYCDWNKEGHTPLGFAPIHLTPWWFGMTFEGNEIDTEGKPTGAGWWWRILQVTLRLMQQRIAVQHAERAARPRRREAVRAGWFDREVQVVRLRRERGERHEPSGEEAGYSHRFIVGGHWRNQWYPSGQVHRQIWISPYVKGPDDKPLVVKPRRAYTWDR